VNAKFAAEKPQAVKAFLQGFLKGLKETIRRPADAVDSILRRDDAAKREVELERLRMAIRDNILTPEVRADGLGAVDMARLEQAIDQIGLVQVYKAKPAKRFAAENASTKKSLTRWRGPAQLLA
jgi:NitT/TauT family transport system substrate-binding protein